MSAVALSLLWSQVAIAGDPAPVEDRAEASLAATVWAMTAGAAMVRVHDVAATVQAARIVGQPVPV